MGFPQALSETRAIQAEVPTNLVGNLSHSLCWKAFPQPLSEGYTIHNIAICATYDIHYIQSIHQCIYVWLETIGDMETDNGVLQPHVTYRVDY